MNINFTIIIQAFNFLISYFILRFFLFKPAVAEINKEKKDEDDIHAQIDQSKTTNELLQKENHDQWRKYQCDFAQQTPRVNSSELFVLRNIAPLIKAPAQDQAVLQATEQKITEIIVDKACNVQT